MTGIVAPLALPRFTPVIVAIAVAFGVLRRIVHLIIIVVIARTGPPLLAIAIAPQTAVLGGGALIALGIPMYLLLILSIADAHGQDRCEAERCSNEQNFS